MMLKYVGDKSNSLDYGETYSCAITTIDNLIMVDVELPKSTYGIGVYYETIRKMLEEWQEV